MEVLFCVVGGSVDVPVSIPFTFNPQSPPSNRFGFPLAVEDWPALDVVLTPEPSGGALATTALVALAVLRGVRSRLRRVR